MKHLCLAFIVVGLLLCGCDNPPEVKQASASGDCKKIELLDSLSRIFREKQVQRWKRTQIRFDSLKMANPKIFGVDSLKILTKEIPLAYASIYAQNYRTLTQRYSDPNGVDIDLTESVWVDREAILSLANTLLEHPEVVDGIRIYFARYPTEAQIIIDPELEREDHSRNTIIFVPTKDSTVGSNVYHRDYYKTGSTGDGIYIYDYNSLCPKKCVGATIGGHQ